MGLLKSPIHPYVANTPNPFTKELQAARELFLREIDNTEGWEGELHPHWVLWDEGISLITNTPVWIEHGEKQEVKLEKKALEPHEVGKSVVPMVSMQSSGHVTCTD